MEEGEGEGMEREDRGRDGERGGEGEGEGKWDRGKGEGREDAFHVHNTLYNVTVGAIYLYALLVMNSLVKTVPVLASMQLHPHIRRWRAAHVQWVVWRGPPPPEAWEV